MGEKWLICGGRGFSDQQMFDAVLHDLVMRLGCPAAVIAGGAGGADAMAKVWAWKRKLPFFYFPAKWHIHGKHAGPIRNEDMLQTGQPNLVIAFPGGRGTADMVNRAKGLNVTVVEVNHESHQRSAVQSDIRHVGVSEPADGHRGLQAPESTGH